MIWSIIQTIGRQGITLIVFAILALFLDPKDFGLLGMAMAWIAFIQVFSEIGFGAALIQRQNVNSKHFSSIFFVNIGIGLLLTLIGIILSWPCAIFFKTPQVQPIMAILSISFVINSFSLTQQTLAQKELRFHSLAIRDISAAIIGGIIGILFALLKFGVWSLVAQSLTTHLTGTILLWNISKWRPEFKEVSFNYIRDLWPYSSRIFAFQIFKYFTQNVDKLIIGYFIGSVALGLYTFAYKLIVYPISTVVGAIGNYLFPKYSQMQEDVESIKRSYLWVIKMINVIIIPLLIVIFLLSPIFIPYIWGPKWIETIPIIRIFTVLAILASFISPVGQLMKALDRPGWLFNWSVFITILISIFICLGIYYKGIIGAAIGITIAYTLGIPINLSIINKLIQLNMRDIINSLFPSICAGLIMYLLLFWVMSSGISLNSIKVYLGLSTGILLYLICLMLIDKPFVINIYRGLIRK